MAGRKTLRIADIQTENILFYDPDLKKKCYDFCAERNIDCLPALDDPKKIFLRDDAKQDFQEGRISKNRIVSSDENIFDPVMLDRFCKQHLLMVYQGNDLTGVVHFCDYNKPVVSLYLYELFFAYEKTLRVLLIQNGLSNEDMISYFKKVEEKGKKKKLEEVEQYQKKVENYYKYDSKRKLLPFEVFYLAT
jgi:hypothetical protein